MADSKAEQNLALKGMCYIISPALPLLLAIGLGDLGSEGIGCGGLGSFRT